MKHLTYVAVAVGLAALAPAAAATPRGSNGPIAFTRYLGPNPAPSGNPSNGAIFVVDRNGGGERQLTHPPDGASDVQPDWTADGSRIAFGRQYPDRPYEIFTMRADGSGVRQIDPGCPAGVPADAICEEETPAWSPSGTRIAFSRPYGRVTQVLGEDTIDRLSIWTIAPDGSNARELTPKPRPAVSEDRAPVWSPDGRRIAFQRENITARPRGGSAIFVVGVDGQGARRVTPWSLRAGDHPDWSPDGRRILFRSDATGPDERFGDLYTVRPDGTRLKRLTHLGDGVDLLSYSFSPDGKRVVFSRARTAGGLPDLYAMDADGGNVRPVVSTPRWESAPDWGPRS
jgi:Tol biopolymer transport system component